MMVREMKPEDTLQVADIEAKSFSQPWSQNAFMDACKDEAAVFLVAEQEGKILGYAGMYVSFDEGEITNVAVDPEARTGGVGTAIIARMQELAADKGVSRIVLEVRVSNAPAIGLYQKQGFEAVGVRKGFYDFPKEDAAIMVYERN